MDTERRNKVSREGAKAHKTDENQDRKIVDRKIL
jgi:hypothetical protein